MAAEWQRKSVEIAPEQGRKMHWELAGRTLTQTNTPAPLVDKWL
jgi:hypothetical protein